ncbi:unnamed protein product [Cercopithifilaria johnstoni]|uniref:Uncharacterized protein n=1 Tax=Cercopithifilaria johnstoni TaxID=2874296 RepID=A0A8J2M733_9BILA|nr:unnamed protein product [Cercopithifilaria johnstoni]
MELRQQQTPIEQFQKLSLIPHAEYKQISAKKEKFGVTADKLLSGYPTSDSYERKSLDGLNIRTVQKSIFKSDITKQSPFKKACTSTNGSSSASIINSITDEMSEINEENIFDMDNSEGSSSLRSRDSSRRLMKHNSAKIASDNNSSISNSSNVSSSLPAKRLMQTKQYIPQPVIQENEYESTNTSEISSKTISSSTMRTSERYKSYETKKHERKKKLKYSNKNQNNMNNVNTGFNKLNSESIQIYQSRSSCSADSQSSRESNILNKKSYKVKSKRSIIYMNSLANIEYDDDGFEKSEKSNILWDHSMPKHTNLLADIDNCSRKSEHVGKKCFKSVAVQTIHSESDSDDLLSPLFTPLLLKNIEENMKGMNEKEIISTIIQTHVKLIKRQAQREKRILDEWNSVISDLEE